jgi:hypothetical protein
MNAQLTPSHLHGGKYPDSENGAHERSYPTFAALMWFSAILGGIALWSTILYGAMKFLSSL